MTVPVLDKSPVFARAGHGFTLAELLIALVILGVIATFTIPKVLSSQQDSRYKSIVKEAAGTIEGAYMAYKASNTVTGGFYGSQLTPYMNYVAFDTSSKLDACQGFGSFTCSVAAPCIRLHNGGILHFQNGAFGNTAATNMDWFEVDPDGVVTDGGTGDTSASAPGKAVWLALFYNGRLATEATLPANSYDGAGAQSACPTCDPPYFNWN